MEKLTFQEEEIMLIIWRLKEGVVKDFLLQMQEVVQVLKQSIH